MASSSWWKLRALIKKNLILKRRNILSTIFEIFFPILMFGLIIALRKCFPIKLRTFQDDTENMEDFMDKASILTSVGYDKGINLNFMNLTILSILSNLSSLLNWTDINYSPDYEKFDDNINFTALIRDIVGSLINKNTSNLRLEYLGIQIMIPPLLICSNLNEQKQERPKIASIGIPNEIKTRMIIESKIYNAFAHLLNNNGSEKFNFELKKNSFIDFKSVEEMEEAIKSPDYLRKPENLICFGIKFSHNETINHYDYSLYFFDFEKMGKEGVQDIPNNAAGMFDRHQSGPDVISFGQYKRGGAYNNMMKVINEYILKKETNNPLLPSAMEYSL